MSKNKTNKQIICLMLLMALLLTVSTSVMAGNTLGKVKITGKTSCSTEDASGIRITWKKVSGATGYQYRYNLFWAKDSKVSDYTVKKTKKRFAKITFQDSDTIKFQVRPYKVVDGKKQYGKWTTCVLSKERVADVLN
ncbi:hypothetical protein SAMN02910358_02451 [Lachnospiraceae bacterium XBB1006]|nr:hypothetical protein SAMN02910358_02451 [Lachnospiraceae bacterium XBB1006]